MGRELLELLYSLADRKWYKVFRNGTEVQRWCPNVFVTAKQGDYGVMHTKQVPLPILSLYYVCRGRGEPQLVHTVAGRILLLRVSLLSGMETSVRKVFVCL